jgi:dTDP-4-dehydrorhamnose 3,5-epimerase
VVLFEPTVHRDDRGYFRDVPARPVRRGGRPHDFVQDNRSKSKGRPARPHAQRARPQGKLVQCVQGKIFDVAVDLRRGSPTFLRWVGATLTGDEANQLWVPPGFAHGFCVLSATATVEYKCTAPYDPTDEMRIAWNDWKIGVNWPVRAPILSEKDRVAHGIDDWLDLLPWARAA